VARQESHFKGLIFDTGCRRWFALRSELPIQSRGAVYHVRRNKTQAQRQPAWAMTFSLSLVVNLMTARRDGASVNGTKGDGQRSFVAAGTPSAFNQTLRPGPTSLPRPGAWKGIGIATRMQIGRPSPGLPDRPDRDNTTVCAGSLPGMCRTVPAPLEGCPFTFPRALLIGCGLPCPGPRFEAILVPIEPFWSAENNISLKARAEGLVGRRQADLVRDVRQALGNADLPSTRGKGRKR